MECNCEGYQDQGLSRDVGVIPSTARNRVKCGWIWNAKYIAHVHHVHMYEVHVNSALKILGVKFAWA